MMKPTTLDMTQDILSSLSSDEVNSISDTTESMQVANILKQSYYNLINRVPLPQHEQLIQLDASTDPSLPVLMYVPEGVTSISWLKYFNNSITDDGVSSGHDINVDVIPTTSTAPAPAGYEYVSIIPVRQFLDLTSQFNPEETNVASFTFTDSTPGDYQFYYKDNRQPTFCCVINDRYVIFDSYDARVDDTLQSTKSMAWARIVPTFQMRDDFIPDLGDEQFPLLLNEAKALAFLELKQLPHPKAEQEIKRGWSTIQRDKSIADRPNHFDQLPNFGRSSPISGTSFFKRMGWDRL